MRFKYVFGLSALSFVLAAGTALAQPVSQTEIDGFIAKVKSCWNIPAEDIGGDASVRVSLELARDGSVVAASLIEPDLSESGLRLGRSALRAVHICAPYSFSTASYDQWKQIEINLQP